MIDAPVLAVAESLQDALVGGFELMLRAAAPTTGRSQPLWEDVAFWAVIASILVALLTVGAGLRQNALQRAAVRRDGLVRQYGQALADALAWMEVPWRIARRVDDEPATVAALTSHVHKLQEEIGYHRRWLAIESELVGDAYGQLIDALKTRTEPYAQDAWQRPPASTPAVQVLDDLNYAVDAETECAAYLDAARSHIRDATRVRWLRDDQGVRPTDRRTK